MLNRHGFKRHLREELNSRLSFDHAVEKMAKPVRDMPLVPLRATHRIKEGKDLFSRGCTTEQTQREQVEVTHTTCDLFERYYDGILRARKAQLAN